VPGTSADTRTSGSLPRTDDGPNFGPKAPGCAETGADGAGCLHRLRALRAVGNNEVNYFTTMAGHGSLEPETDSKLCAIMNDLPPMSSFDRGGR
jgi:hypothetical protein